MYVDSDFLRKIDASEWMVNLSKFPSGHHTTMMIDINAFYYVHCATMTTKLYRIGVDWIGSFSFVINFGCGLSSWEWKMNIPGWKWHFFLQYQITPISTGLIVRIEWKMKGIFMYANKFQMFNETECLGAPFQCTLFLGRTNAYIAKFMAENLL